MPTERDSLTVIPTDHTLAVIPTERSAWRNLGSIATTGPRSPATGFLGSAPLTDAPVGMTDRGLRSWSRSEWRY